MKTDKIDIEDNFFDMIKNLSADEKRKLIKKISESLEEKKPENSWKVLYGAWQSEDSAENIINELRASRHSNRQIEDL